MDAFVIVGVKANEYKQENECTTCKKQIFIIIDKIENFPDFWKDSKFFLNGSKNICISYPIIKKLCQIGEPMCHVW